MDKTQDYKEGTPQYFLLDIQNILTKIGVQLESKEFKFKESNFKLRDYNLPDRDRWNLEHIQNSILEAEEDISYLIDALDEYFQREDNE